jgi:cellulose synthase/poly-beta-1,6-N-acetylglucosamine synthase-like glycosyltransferase
LIADHDALCSDIASSMPPITAFLQTHNDARHLGRALESLRPCDEILIVDRGSTDHTLRIAREYGATLWISEPNTSIPAHFARARHEWVFCLLPTETLTESLEASLFEWKLYSSGDIAHIPSAAVVVKDEAKNSAGGSVTSTRLVPKGWGRWNGPLPQPDPRSLLLQGDLLRFGPDPL